VQSPIENRKSSIENLNMAQKRRFLDVWITEGNTVYREVPFAVVTDWIQQGRLLADDKLRPSGTAEWFPIGGSPAFAAYMPKVEENRAEDQAEALERVEVEFQWKRPEDDDDDVDMIPLIDVSLVLLIFFMMTASVGSDAIRVDTPMAQNRTVELSKDMKLWVGISPTDLEGAAPSTTRPYYSFGEDENIIINPTNNPDAFMSELGRKLDQVLKEKAGRDAQGLDAQVKLRLKADHHLSIETIKAASVKLKTIKSQMPGTKFRTVQVIIYGQVSDPKE
jgi:hypothetical protein